MDPEGCAELVVVALAVALVVGVHRTPTLPHMVAIGLLSLALVALSLAAEHWWEGLG
jgi:hypothetical protein